MIPRFFVDLRLNGVDESGGLSIPVMANQAFRILHGAFRNAPGEYALALPKCKPGKGSTVGDVLRVFASDEAKVTELLANISGHHFIRDYCSISAIQQVPDDFAGPWMRFRRFRPSNKNAGRKTEELTLREKRMAFAAEKKLPYFLVSSHTNSHSFSVFVQVEEGEQGAMEAQPDNYGLCVSSRPFSLPVIPM